MIKKIAFFLGGAITMLFVLWLFNYLSFNKSHGNLASKSAEASRDTSQSQTQMIEEQKSNIRESFNAEAEDGSPISRNAMELWTDRFRFGSSAPSREIRGAYFSKEIINAVLQNDLGLTGFTIVQGVDDNHIAKFIIEAYDNGPIPGWTPPPQGVTYTVYTASCYCPTCCRNIDN